NIDCTVAASCGYRSVIRNGQRRALVYRANSTPDDERVRLVACNAESRSGACNKHIGNAFTQELIVEKARTQRSCFKAATIQDGERAACEHEEAVIDPPRAIARHAEVACAAEVFRSFSVCRDLDAGAHRIGVDNGAVAYVDRAGSCLDVEILDIDPRIVDIDRSAGILSRHPHAFAVERSLVLHVKRASIFRLEDGCVPVGDDGSWPHYAHMRAALGDGIFIYGIPEPVTEGEGRAVIEDQDSRFGSHLPEDITRSSLDVQRSFAPFDQVAVEALHAFHIESAIQR